MSLTKCLKYLVYHVGFNVCDAAFVKWDFTIDDRGIPLLIEANLRGGSIWMSEMAHGCGCFGDKTSEILSWLHKMEKLSYSERVEWFEKNLNF